MFHRPTPYFAVEAVQQFVPKVIGFQLAAGERRWYIVGCYLAPNNTSTIESVIAALKERPRGAKLFVAGYFNVNLAEPEGDWRGEDIAAAMATEVMEDKSAHFLLPRRLWCQDGRMWSMIWEGREVRYRIDYILGTYLRLFGIVSVQDSRNNSDHYMVLGCLHSAPLREHVRYLGGHKRLPLRPPTILTREDGIFAALRRAVLKPLAREARKNAWILVAKSRLVDKRVSARWDITKNQALIRRLGHAIKTSLQEHRKRRSGEQERRWKQ